MVRTLIATLALALLPAPLPAAAPLLVAAPQGEPESGEILAPAQLEWSELVARDKLLGFSARTATQARRDLEQGGLSSARRAQVLLALGLGGALRELPLLESSAVEGPLAERCAAVLALGELGGGQRMRLAVLMDDPEPEVAECALLAALRVDPVAMRERVDRIAGDPASPLADEARRVLLFSIDPASAPPSRAARRLLELRFEVARRYGLIEGQPYELLVLRRLVDSNEFLDRVVLGAAAELDDPAVADQLLGALVEGGGEAALRAAARGIPGPLAELVRHGLWTPSENDWEAILSELARERSPSEARLLLRLARERAPQRLRTLELLARIGELDDLPVLAAAQAGYSPAEQVEAAAVWGASDSPRALQPLAELSLSSDPAVRSAALLQRVRLRVVEAETEVRSVLSDPAHPLRPAMFDRALQLAHDPLLHDLFEDVLDGLRPGPERLALAAALAEQGHLSSLEIVLEELAAGLPEGEAGTRALRALGRRPTYETREYLARQFPVEGNVDANVELCLGLVRARDAAVLPVLRAALWSDPFERSVLAAALVESVGGRFALRMELDRVPRNASSRDLRRVGFAMGFLGGIEEAQWLAEHLGGGSGDPTVQGAYLGALAARTL